MGPSECAPGRVLRVLQVENPFCGGVSGKGVKGRRSSERVFLLELGVGHVAECFDGKDTGP